MIIATHRQLEEWIAMSQDCDPVPVGILFARYQSVFTDRKIDGELIATPPHGDIADCTVALWVNQMQGIPLVIGSEVQVDPLDGSLAQFSVQRITDGVWALWPSLNIEDFLHAFVTLYDVPDPAPWEGQRRGSSLILSS